MNNVTIKVVPGYFLICQINTFQMIFVFAIIVIDVIHK